MRKILIRSGMTPLDNFDAAHIINNNSIGGNVGNLIYAYGVYRTLLTEDTVIDADYYSRDSKRADEINENYDCYIIPLADAFRETFANQLRDYTKLIKKLKIPVIVVGVGLRAPFEPKLNEGFSFDQDVKGFVDAVLEKSNIIGVRGQITADYLSKLGYKAERDHTVIGCPSMYTFGRELNIKDLNINENSRVCVNSSRLSPDNVLDFIDRSKNEFSNYMFIPQWMKELELTYSGISELKYLSNYPSNRDHEIYKNNNVRFFLNAASWLRFMKESDFSFGARLHGNVTATIAGTPSLIIPKDARMRELADYHKLTSVWWNDIDNNTNIHSIMEKSDFNSPETVQKENFDHFIDFLDKNNVNHIYKNNLDLNDAPLDRMAESLAYTDPVQSITACNIDEVLERSEAYYKVKNNKLKTTSENVKSKINFKNKEIKSLVTEVNAKNKEVKYLRGTLNRKSVKFTLNIADKFSGKTKDK